MRIFVLVEKSECLYSKKIFLVTGRKSFDLYLNKYIKAVLNNYETARFSDFSENPKLSEIKKGIIEFSKKKFDLSIDFNKFLPVPRSGILSISQEL